MGNGIQAVFGNRLSAGHAFSERAIGNPPESGLYHPDFQQSGISKALQNLVALSLRGAFLEIRIGWLTEFRLDPGQARVEITQAIAQTNFELADVFHRHYPELLSIILLDRQTPDGGLYRLPTLPERPCKITQE